MSVKINCIYCITSVKQKMFTKSIYDKLNDQYNKSLNTMNKLSENNNTGGEIRGANGSFGENFVESIIEYINQNENENFECKVGNTSMLTARCGEHEHEIQVDKHVFYKSRLVYGIEVKSYLDICYVKRAIMDFVDVKRYNQNVKTIIFAFEDACNQKEYNYYNAVYPGVIDACFFMVPGKRRSDRPNYKKEFRKQLVYDNVKRFYEYILENKG